jgi:LysR family transcriptional regulator, transcriptional activator of the cysJI operon
LAGVQSCLAKADPGEEAYAAVVSASGKLGGHLALGASQTIGQYVLPNLVAAFLRENPRVSVTAMIGNTDTILEAMMEHRIHLGMVERPALRKDIHTEPFMDDKMVLVVPASHVWTEREIALGDLRDAPMLMREFGSGSRRVVENALRRAGLRKKELTTRMELGSTEGLLSAVEAGLGVTFVSRWAVRSQLVPGTLKLARVRGLRLPRKFSLAYPAGPEPAGSGGAFRLFLLAHSMKLMAAGAATRVQKPHFGTAGRSA